MSNIIHVAAAAMIDNNDRVLLSRRRPDSHQGGLWEFPGGKLCLLYTSDAADDLYTV